MLHKNNANSTLIVTTKRKKQEILKRSVRWSLVFLIVFVLGFFSFMFVTVNNPEVLGVKALIEYSNGNQSLKVGVDVDKKKEDIAQRK